ncbi:C4-dicarboxylate transport protein [Streptomyces sp. YIM 121038]|uniref:cation:dicarboxylate symporter family transporter n=1 Tax=Streptomyces sp. YIM 121038 TaxID=2136401 RepID=UPI001110AC6E|nr:cation:dicarboxylase symporter family transporter [Streptomyces sp. YIM 121038]QCX80923.1 C4-dicarboxylate transport protein [Streptomyces sp. YIM 121038]
MSSRTENGAAAAADTPQQRPRWRRAVGNTGLQVLAAAVAAAVFGVLAPDAGAELKPLADAFIALVRLTIPPIVFLVVVTGIVSVGGMKAAGRIALKAVVYFEVVTTIGTLLGMAAINLVRPGEGVAPPAGASDDLDTYVEGAKDESVGEFLLGLVPHNVVGAFAAGDVIQVLVFAVLFAVALLQLPRRTREPVLRGCGVLADVFFRIIALVIRLAPAGVFGAVAYTVGAYGPQALTALMKYVGLALATLLVFLTLVLGTVTRLTGVSLPRLIRGLRPELVVVLGTSSSEAVMPHLMARLEQFGCKRDIVGLVVPTGYSFNLDGVAVTVPMSAVFIAQVYGVDLDLGDQLTLFLVFLLLSKGTAGVTGSAFVTLANLIAAVHVIPVAGLALILSVERFLSLMRAVTNVLGNAVAAVAVARWEPGGLDAERFARTIGRRPAHRKPSQPHPQP